MKIKFNDEYQIILAWNYIRQGFSLLIKGTVKWLNGIIHSHPYHFIIIEGLICLIVIFISTINCHIESNIQNARYHKLSQKLDSIKRTETITDLYEK